MADSRRNKVIVCFLPSSSSLLEKSWLNAAAARFAPPTKDGREPMVHVELFFPDYEVEDVIGGTSCGIHYGGKVFMAPKQFTRRDWEFRSFQCRPEQYDKIKNFCTKQVGGGFNYGGYFTPCNLAARHRVSKRKQQKWYCSELVAHALDQGNLIQMNSVTHTHPDILYDAVTAASNTYLDCGRQINTKLLEL